MVSYNSTILTKRSPLWLTVLILVLTRLALLVEVAIQKATTTLLVKHVRNDTLRLKLVAGGTMLVVAKCITLLLILALSTQMVLNGKTAKAVFF